MCPPSLFSNQLKQSQTTSGNRRQQSLPIAMKHTRHNIQFAARLAGQYWPCDGMSGTIGERDSKNLGGSMQSISTKPETTNFVHNPNTQGSSA